MALHDRWAQPSATKMLDYLEWGGKIDVLLDLVVGTKDGMHG